MLITGAARPDETAPRTGGVRAYNSIYVIDHEGTLIGQYDKVHLVPFGEYLPFQHFLESIGLTQLVKMPGGFLAGDRRRPLAVPRAPNMLPLICYEVIFPGEAVPRDIERPGWLINLTNDGWFGNSTGPHQHFQQARVRAIEEGLPLVRAANTGISAVIDPVGRIVKSLPLGTEGLLDAPLPRADRADDLRADRGQPRRIDAGRRGRDGDPPALPAALRPGPHVTGQGASLTKMR